MFAIMGIVATKILLEDRNAKLIRLKTILGWLTNFI